MTDYHHEARRPPRPPKPSNWANIEIPTLIKNIARHWRLSPRECPECHGATYSHICARKGWIGYRRCPSCRLNFINKDSTNFTDKAADDMLDAGARRTPLIGNPYINPTTPSRSSSRQ